MNNDNLDKYINFRLKLHPLEGMKFVIAGKLKESKADVTKKISSMGGQVVSKCDKSVAAVISTKGNEWIEFQGK